MKVFNILEIEFIKFYLRKYFITKEIEYDFYDTSNLDKELNLTKIMKNNYDAIVIQNNYFKTKGIEIIKEIRNRGINTPILCLWFDLSDKQLIKTGQDINKYRDVYLTPAKGEEVLNFFDEMMIKKNENSDNQNTVLFVDDSKMMHEVFNNSIDRNKYKIVNAYDGKEGLKAYKNNFPDIVVTDIEMPKMNGLEMCKNIKELNDGRYIPILVLSSKYHKYDIETATKYGADDYLTKPIDTEELNYKLDDYIESINVKKKSKVITYIEDKILSERVMHNLFKNQINVISAKTAKELTTLIKEKTSELLIVDFDNTKINISYFENIRQFFKGNDFKIVGISSKQKISVVELQKIGVYKYFQKPFEIEKLTSLVEQIVISHYANYKKEFEYMLSSITSLVKALEARDQYTKGHSERVAKYSMMIGKELNLSEEELKNLEIGAGLHDIGKIGIRDDVLLKGGRLNDEEYLDIQKHAVIGAEILMPIKSLKNIINLVLFHHERWDGKGYPNMIEKSEIPIGARIIAVADTFDALTSKRPYRDKISKNKALSIIEENIGTQLCPTTAKKFIELMKDKEIIEINSKQGVL